MHLALQVAAQVVTTITAGDVTSTMNDQTLARAAASIDICNRRGHWEIRCHLASFFASTRHIQTNISNFPREFLTAGLIVMQLNLILQISMKALAWLDILENFIKVMTVLCF